MHTHHGAHRARIHPINLGAFFLALCSTAGLAAEFVQISWDTEGRFSGKESVAPGKFLEVCGKLHVGTNVSWNFDATAAVDFNAHYHAGNDVLFPSKLAAATRGRDVLRVKADQDFCWMWTNKSGAPVEVTFALQR